MGATDKSWEKCLNPATLRGNFIAISLFIAAFDMFRDSVVEKPEAFFSNGLDGNGLTVDEEYKTNVLARAKNTLFASLLWFKERGAMNQADINPVDLIRLHRTEAAHELIGILANPQ